jgi:hypothetical protein
MSDVLENKNYCLAVYFELMVFEWDWNNTLNYMYQSLESNQHESKHKSRQPGFTDFVNADSVSNELVGFSVQ